MEIVLESKSNKDVDSKYYSVYSLKMNRLKKNDSQKVPISSTVVQFLEKEATLNKDFSLNVMQTNVPSKNECNLRENLANKIQKGTFYASKNGSISFMNLGFINENDEETKSICYYNLFRNNDDSTEHEYLICFILRDEKSNLDLFRIELDYYCDNHLKVFFNNLKDTNLDKKLQDLLINWYNHSIDYISRLISTLNEHLLSVFIEEAFTCGSIELNENLESRYQNDLKIMFKSFDCSSLVMNNDSIKYFDEKQEISKLIINSDSNKMICFSKNESSEFSLDCARSLKSTHQNDSNPFKTKQIAENYKLNLIQDLNTFNRFLRKGTNHYYDLYKVYLYLKHSKISKTLISMFENCAIDDMNLMKTFNVIIQFYNEKEVEKNNKPCQIKSS